MWTSILLSALVGFILANPARLPLVKDASPAYALDLSSATSQSTFQCIFAQGYSTIFARVYNGSIQGCYDSSGGQNVRYAYNAGLGTEVYMSPQPASPKSAFQQVDEVFQGLNSDGITVRTLWIQVTSPINWPNDPQGNLNFISGLVSRLGQYGISAGIYTNVYDWNQITSDCIGLTGTPLWYWSVNGYGVAGETPADFNDFSPFGCWTGPTVKQFGQSESVCSIYVNRNVYYSNGAAEDQKIQKTPLMENGKIVVGSRVSQ